MQEATRYSAHAIGRVLAFLSLLIGLGGAVPPICTRNWALAPPLTMPSYMKPSFSKRSPQRMQPTRTQRLTRTHVQIDGNKHTAPEAHGMEEIESPDPRRVLSRAEARATYNRMGESIKDSESAYGGPAVRSLIHAAELGRANAVFEYGVGPGRLAQKLFAEELPKEAVYTAVDQSPVMVGLARKRLAPFIEDGRCDVFLIDGNPLCSRVQGLPSDSFDVVISTYVLDLLSEEDVHCVLSEAWRILRPGGRLCLSGITYGIGWRNRFAVWLWELVHRLRPSIVGGCRHQNLVLYLKMDARRGHTWHILHHEKIPGFGKSILAWIWSEVVVAMKPDQ